MQNKILIYFKILILVSCVSNEYKKITIEGSAFGTSYCVHYYCKKKVNLKLQIDSLLNEITQTLSIYDDNSIISKISKNRSVMTNLMFREIFKKSQQISEITSGAFDITVSPLVEAWGFGKSERVELSQEKIDSIKKFVGYKLINIKNHQIEKKDLRVSLNMNGIAQGYAVDLIAEFLEDNGIHSYLVELGGEVRAGNCKPDGSKWTIDIEKPADFFLAPKQGYKRIYLCNMSLATSGSYRNYFEKEGKRYSHTIDPFTGYPVTHSLLSVSVLTKDCTTADALATAFMVLGVEKSLKLCDSLNIDAFFISAGKNKNYIIASTNNFSNFFYEK